MVKSKAKKERKRFESEGRTLLREQEGSDAELAKKLEVGKAIIGHWRTGRRLPSEESKEKIELVLGIPRKSWDIKPGAEETPASPEAPPTAPDTPSPTSVITRTREIPENDTLGLAIAQIDSIKAELASHELTDTARGRARDTLTKLMALKYRLERDRDLLEDRVVREHPKWLATKTAILEALKPYPNAAKAVAEALK